MNSKNEIAREALEQTMLLREKYPDLPYWETILLQLEYIMRLIEDRTFPKSKLANINIGLITARELESLDAEYANLMHKVSKIVDDLKWGR